MNETFVFINNIKYINLGIITYQNKKYMMVIEPKPTLFRKFFEIIEYQGNVTYRDIDNDTKIALDELYNKQNDIIYLNGKTLRVINYGLILMLFVELSYFTHLSLQKENPYTNKKVSISAELKSTPKQNNDDFKSKVNFEEQIYKNTQISDKERALLIILNQNLTSSFGDINFSNFYKKASYVKYFYHKPVEDEHLKSSKITMAYYNKVNNYAVFSTEEKPQNFVSDFFHENLHMARCYSNGTDAYPFGRIFNEGGTAIIDCLFCNINHSHYDKCYIFESDLVNLIIRFIGPQEFFNNYFKANDEAIVSALASYLKDRDKVIAMLSNAEEYAEECAKLHEKEAEAVKTETKQANVDKDGYYYADYGWILNGDGTQIRKTRNLSNLGVSSKLWHNFTKYHELLLELYYSKQVEKIMTNYYASGTEEQNILHFLADTNKFDSFLGKQYSDAVALTAPYSYIVDGHGMVSEDEGFDKINEKVSLLKELYCSINNISLDKLDKIDRKYQPFIINPLEDFDEYSDIFENKGDILKEAHNDTIATQEIVNTNTKDSFELSQIVTKVAFTVDRYKKAKYNNQYENNKTK